MSQLRKGLFYHFFCNKKRDFLEVIDYQTIKKTGKSTALYISWFFQSLLNKLARFMAW